MIRCMLAIVAVLALCSCTDEQIRIAQTLVDKADATQRQVDQAVETAEKALDIAKKIAAATNSAEAAKAIETATAALQVAREGQASVSDATKTAHLTLDAAKASKEAGGSTLDVIIAAALAAAGPLGLWANNLRKLWAVTKAFKQTVAGVSKGRENMPTEVWDAHMAPALSAAQDEDVRLRVKAIAPPVVIKAA